MSFKNFSSSIDRPTKAAPKTGAEAAGTEEGPSAAQPDKEPPKAAPKSKP